MMNYCLTIEYDGSAYHGWQRQKGVLTIQEVVETRLAVMTQAPVRLMGAGRTDAGVHARGQVANFLSKTEIPPERLLQGPCQKAHAPKTAFCRISDSSAKLRCRNDTERHH